MHEIEISTGAAVRDVRVEVRFKNNLILRAMKDAGIKSIKELSERSGVGYAAVCELVNMRRPACARGDWRKAAIDVATALHREPEEIFSWFQRTRALPQSVFALGEVASEALSVRTPTDPERLLIHDELRGVISGMLDTVDERKRQAVKMRFAFEPYCREHTYDEIGEALGVSSTRAMMLINRFLRAMRHPAKQKVLAQYRDVCSA